MAEEIIYGIHPVLELLQSDPGRIQRLWVARESGNPRLRRLISEASQKGVGVHFEPKAALRRRAGCDAHQGVVASVAPIRLLDGDELLAGAEGDCLLLILDGISDPQNLGAILRSAEAAAVYAVFLPERRTAPLSAAAIKASAGAALDLRIAGIGNVSYFIERLQRKNFRVIGLDPEAGTDWCDADLTGPVALVLGSEGEGLRRLVKETCDQRVRLPMLGRVQSLNVSAAAAAVLFESVRQRKIRARRIGNGTS